MQQKKGFTLIELLVVIAIIALLLAVLVPALQLAKLKAMTAVCMVNLKNLSLGWTMYQEENDGKIMAARMDGAQKKYAWIREPRDASGTLMTYNQTSPPVTDEDEIRGIKLGKLNRYIDSPGSYGCPADKVKSKYDGTEKLVTYAIPRCLNGGPPGTGSYPYAIKKYGEIKTPASRYNFVETAETRNYNMGGQFSLATPDISGASGKWGWWGPMAVNHGNSSALGFCDGHSENRKWKDTYTKWRVEKLIKLGVDSYDQDYPGSSAEFPANMIEDINYMATGWAYSF